MMHATPTHAGRLAPLPLLLLPLLLLLDVAAGVKPICDGVPLQSFRPGIIGYRGMAKSKIQESVASTSVCAQSCLDVPDCAGFMHKTTNDKCHLYSTRRASKVSEPSGKCSH